METTIRKITPVIFGKTKAYTKGPELSVYDLPAMKEKKVMIYIESPYSHDVLMAWELMQWKLIALLRIKMYKAIPNGKLL